MSSFLFDTTHNKPCLNEMIKEPPLSRTDERILMHRWQEKRDKGAWSQLLISNAKFVYFCSRLYQTPYVTREDLFQVGMIAMMDSIDNYDLSRDEATLATFATRRVKGEMADYAFDNSLMVRVPREARRKKVFFHYNEIMEGASPDEHKIAKALDIDIQTVREVINYLYTETSLLNYKTDKDIPKEAADFAPHIPQPHATNPVVDDVLENEDKSIIQVWARAAFETLTEREQVIVSQNIIQNPSVQMWRLAVNFGISSARASQLKKSALTKLRLHAVKSGLAASLK